MRPIPLIAVIIAALSLSCGDGGTPPTDCSVRPLPAGCPPPPVDCSVRPLPAGCPIPTSAPTVSSISPAMGTSAGGTSVTVVGTDFRDGATLTIGGTAATNVAVSATSLTATTAARQPPGPVDVVVRNPDGGTATLGGAFTYFTLRANPGGPYTAEGNRNITMNGTGSVGDPFSIRNFLWNCGQNPHGKACDQDTPTPTFEYKQEGVRGSPDRTYTVTLTVVDTAGNRDTQTTTVRVRQTY